MIAFNRVINAFENAGLTVTHRGSGRASAQAPGHSPADRSVTITETVGRVLVHPHAGETLDQVLGAVGLAITDLFDDPKGITYEYPDGRKVSRTPAKKFSQAGNTKGNQIYRADRLANSTTVYMVEGEQDVHALESEGVTATCTAMGAGKAHLADLTPLYGKTVIVVQDKDEPGRKHAAQVAELLDGKATVVIVEAKVGKDAADHIAAGLGVDDFQMVETPAAESAELPGPYNAEAEAEFARPKLWRATELVAARQPQWLAKGRIPRSAITLLVGGEGIGKSAAWVWVASPVTTGRAVPEFGIPARDPEDVIVIVTEDDWASTVRPRLEVAGADLDRIHVICAEQDGSGAPTFPADIHLITNSHVRPGLVVVDAWLDTVPGGLSVKDPQQARRALHPWREAATQTGAAVMLLTHTNRISTGNARDMYGASGELRKKARMSLFAQADPEHEGCVLIGPEKSNLVGKVPASRFRMDSVQHFAPTEDDDGTVPKLVLIGESEQTMREHIADQYDDERGDGKEDRNGIEEWLMSFLNMGSQKANDVYSAADANGYSKDQAKRAKKKLGIKASRPGGEGPWFWSLPNLESIDPQLGSTPTPVSESALPSSLAAPLQVNGMKESDLGSTGGLESGVETHTPPRPLGQWRVSGEPLRPPGDVA
ncbi:AAA family ATPase [Rhodococcus pseudokoreensis]|uniref:AAA family ATPase n=1 Tax=Rhodococcus pseudokoreensis TaxID=2811421 RepID=A0A974ZTY7_9NOCA|nr:AAA family ATPase [Rhodococcus pseudokoreensis]QSE90306.1 AAA family ATPase [Rhodococcus pseudokoreensis]